YARTQAETGADMNQEIDSAPGLVHRWSMNEGTGTSVADSAGGSYGALQGGNLQGGPAWITAAAEIPTFGPGTCGHLAAPGCVACSSDASCDDSNLCTTDSCVGGACQHALVSCDDGDACTSDACDSQTGLCAHPAAPAGTPCTGADPCMSGSTCDGNGSCTGGSLESCDDGNACTSDLCGGAA